MLIIDSSNAVIAQTDDPDYRPLAGYQVVPVPDDFNFEDAREWAWNGAALIRDPALVLQRVKTQRLADLAALRYAKETGGITLNGVRIETDEKARINLSGAVSRAMLRPESSVNWKISSLVWVPIAAEQIIEIGLAVSGFIENCFTCEMNHALAINALETAEAVQAYDVTTGWPA